MSPVLPNTYIPPVDNAKDVANHPMFKRTLDLFDEAALAMKAFWPQDIANHKSYSIVLVRDDTIHVETIAFDRATRSQAVVVGIDRFHAFVRQIKLKDDLLSAAILTLALESFHLTQMHRMRQALFSIQGRDHTFANVRAKSLQKSGFAQGIEESMSPAWLDCAMALAVAHPDRACMPSGIAEASDVVSELRADIRALNCLRVLDRDWPDISKKLLVLRRSDELRDSDQYRVADSMATILRGGLPAEDEAIPILWRMAAEKISGLDAQGPLGALARNAVQQIFRVPNGSSGVNLDPK